MPENPKVLYVAEGDAIIADRLAGMTLKDLSEKYNEPRDRLRKWLTAKGATLTPEQILENTRRKCEASRADPGAETLRQMIAEGLDTSAMAAKLGVSESTVTIYRNKHGLRAKDLPTPQSRDPGPEALRKMITEGMTRPQIAEKLGVSLKTASSYFQKHKVRTDYRKNNHPSRQQLRAAIAKTDTRTAAADSLGISQALFTKLCASHNISGTGNKGKAASRKRMNEMARAGTAEACAAKNEHSKIVGTDMRQLIDMAVSRGMVTKYPPAFVAITTRDPLPDHHRKALAEYAKQRDAAWSEGCQNACRRIR